MSSFQYLDIPVLKNVSIVCLKFKLNWASCILPATWGGAFLGTKHFPKPLKSQRVHLCVRRVWWSTQRGPKCLQMKKLFLSLVVVVFWGEVHPLLVYIYLQIKFTWESSMLEWKEHPLRGQCARDVIPTLCRTVTFIHSVTSDSVIYICYWRW